MISVFLLFGGKSTEHFISLKTGSFIFRTLDRTKYNVKPILITEEGKWLIPREFPSSLPELSVNVNSVIYEKLFREQPINEFYLPKSLDCDVVFLGLHGGEGENGTIQAFLELLRVPYTGSKVLASALAMDKEKSNFLYKAIGLNVANFTTFTKKEFSFLSEAEIQKRLTQKEISFPCFVKPNNGGSSVGAGIANHLTELKQRLQTVFNLEEKAFVQNLLKGMEVSCGVIEFKSKAGFQARSLYPTQILPKSEFFDFEAKYKKGGSEEITPAPISEELTNQVRNMSLLAHNVLGCKAYSRTDFIIQDGVPFILETNTLPGMTETSLIPQQVRYEKMDMKDILDLLIENALES